MPSLNLHVYPSSIAHESRMLKETKTLAAAGLFDRILLVGIGDGKLPTRERLDERREIWRVGVLAAKFRFGLAGKVLRLIEWSLRILASLIGKRVNCVNAHSLAVLPLACLIKLLWGARLVYDTHELETESVAMKGVRQRLAKIFERALIRYCDTTIVVSDSIAAWYRDAYRLTSIVTVRNMPESCRTADGERDLLRRAFHLQPSDRVLLYQGILERGRGIEVLLDVFRSPPAGSHVVFMGYGSLESQIREHAAASSNIHFHPAVPPQELAKYSAGADVGLCIIEACCLSYSYCLPNKLFEYLAAGIPVIASNLVDMATIVNRHKCGWLVEPSSDSIARLVANLSDDDIATARQNARHAKSQFTWDNDVPTLLAAYANKAA